MASKEQTDESPAPAPSAPERGLMTKRMFSLSRPSYEVLVSEAARLGIPVSEMLRRVVDAWVLGLPSGRRLR